MVAKTSIIGHKIFSFCFRLISLVSLASNAKQRVHKLAKSFNARTSLCRNIWISFWNSVSLSCFKLKTNKIKFTNGGRTCLHGYNCYYYFFSTFLGIWVVLQPHFPRKSRSTNSHWDNLYPRKMIHCVYNWWIRELERYGLEVAGEYWSELDGENCQRSGNDRIKPWRQTTFSSMTDCRMTFKGRQ